MSGSAFSRQVDVFLNEDLSPQAMSAALSATAEQGKDELIRSGQASPRFTRSVDGIEGAPAAAVKPSGIIVYQFNYLGEVAAFALAYLQGRSPVRGGTFRSSFFFGISNMPGADGRFVKAAAFKAEAVTADVVEIIIGNTQPYNRLVDVQLAGTTRVKFKVPADIYADAARAVIRRFGNSTNAFRRYDVRFPGQYMLQGARRRGKPVQSPALVLSVRG